MALDSDDEWVITTKTADQQNSSRTTPPTPTTFWEETDKEATPPISQQVAKRTPETFSRQSRTASPSNKQGQLKHHVQYKPAPSSTNGSATPSPTPFSPSTGVANKVTTFSRQIPHPTNSNSWSMDGERKRTAATATSPLPASPVDYDMVAMGDMMRDPAEYVANLITVYRSTDQFIALKDGNNTPYLFQSLADLLPLCSDPCTWVQSVLCELGVYFTTCRKSNRDLTPKFQRLLVQAICRGLDLYMSTVIITHQDDEKLIDLDQPEAPPQPQQQSQDQPQPSDHDTPDLIVFTDDEEEGPDLIDLSFAEAEDEGGEDDETDASDDEVVIIDIPATITQQTPNDQKPSQVNTDKETKGDSSSIDKEKDDDCNQGNLNNPTYPANGPPIHPLTKEHQVAFIDMVNMVDVPPSIVYYAMETFGVAHLLHVGAEYEYSGTILCRQLLRQGFYKEAVSCIIRLHQQEHFPMASLADFMFNVGQGIMLLDYVSGKIGLQYSLLSFINIQLRYNFAGSLGVVDSELLDNVEKDSALIPPMQRMRERRFQKDLLTCGQKLVDKLDLPLDKYYFIWLSQRYAAIRWAVSARSAQQSAEGNYSIESSSNYNGIIELIVDNTPTLAKLVIKELVDLMDGIGAQYFATVSGQEAFFLFYQALLPNQRMLGVIRGERISYSVSSYHGKKQRSSNQGNLIDYVLPTGVHYKMVDDHVGILEMKASLAQSKRCGLDSEWVPTLAKAGKEQTALLQLATDDGMVYLLDMKTLLKPTNRQLLTRAETVLRELFESDNCVKLAYDFSGDMTLLIQCMPNVRNWHIKNFRDMNKIKDYSVNKKGNHIPGGLAGVVSTFLGVSMNKKQQLSNWEKRPLTNEQAIYAACDAYSLLEVYDVLVSQDNDFAKEMAAPAPIKTMPKASVLYSPVSPLSTEPTGMKMDLPETSPSQAAASSSLDLIQL